MKRKTSRLITIACITSALLGLAGCAEMEATNTKSLLSAAGFHTVSPTTPLQKEVYAHLTASRVERVTAKNKTIYTFKDEQAGIAYVGHDSEYHRYVKLC